MLAVNTLDREGELALQLTCDEELIYSVAFSFLDIDGKLAVAIGCVQGPQAANGLTRISAATKSLHGLRPKNLMVRLVRQIGFEFGCRNLILVGNKNRTSHRSIKKGKVFCDYDELWRELGAYRRQDGDFQLPCEDFPLPVMEEIPSHKRSEVRRRHALISGVIHSIRHQLNCGGTGLNGLN